MMQSRTVRIAALCFAAVAPLVLGGCWTRLTTPKETREFRVTYPELEEAGVVQLRNARDRMANTFIMTSEVYVDGVRRFQRSTSTATGNVFVFRPGSQIEINVPGHETEPVNGIYLVTPEGTIDAGQLTDFVVAGKTRAEIRAEMETALAAFLKPWPDPEGQLRVSVNIPPNRTRITGLDDVLGQATVLSLAGTNGGPIVLRGEDDLLTVLGRAESYFIGMDWHEVAIYRKIKTQQRNERGELIEYYIVILCNLEKTVYEDPNLNIDIRDGDLIIVHPEKAPLIVEIVNTARMISDVWGALKGAEDVLEDIFGSS